MGFPVLSISVPLYRRRLLKLKKLQPVRVGLIREDPGEIVEPDVAVGDDEKGWDLKGIKIAEEDDASTLYIKMRAQQVKCCAASVEVPAHILAVVKLAEQSLDLSCEVENRE